MVRRLKLEGCDTYRDTRGKWRDRVRYKGTTITTWLASAPDRDERLANALATRARMKAGERLPIGAGSRIKPGSLAWHDANYGASSSWDNLALNTQDARRRIRKKLVAQHGDKPLARMEPSHVYQMMEAMKDTPHEADATVKTLRAIVRHAIEAGHLHNNPTYGVKLFKSRNKKSRSPDRGHKPWDEDRIARYRSAHPSGTRARMALELALNVACRVSDASQLGRHNIIGDRIIFDPQKDGERVDVPILPELAMEIAKLPADQTFFLETKKGRAFQVKGLGNKIHDWIVAAGIEVTKKGGPKGYSYHGLRKACLIRLAEARCTTHELRAVSGHMSLSELEVYVAAADRKRAATEAMARLEESLGDRKLANAPDMLAKTATETLENKD